MKNEEIEAEPHSMWEYPCRALTDVVSLMQFDFLLAVPEEKQETTGIVEFTRYGCLFRVNTGKYCKSYPQRNMKRKFQDFLTLLMSTEKLLTRAGFELAGVNSFSVDISFLTTVLLLSFSLSAHAFKVSVK